MVEGLGSVDATLAEARRVFALQSAYKWLAKTSSVNERKEHLRRLRDEVVRRSADIERAIITDLPQPPSRDVPREVGFRREAADYLSHRRVKDSHSPMRSPRAPNAG
jgi:acyl-CoA reductase-like NAD-dependent aldehyde dehydrogenase